MDSSLSRRGFVKAAGASSLAVAGGSALAGCGGGDEGPQAERDEGSQAQPRPASRGGNLRVAMIGGGTAETYNPSKMFAPIDALHGFSVYDPLVRPAPNHETEPGLAVGWEANADATTWEIELREGVTWHDGKPFGPADVIYTLRAFADPASTNALLGQRIRLDEVKAVGKNKVRVPLKVSYSQFKEEFIYPNTAIIQDGATDFDKPVGTGPFRLKTFTPGQRSVAEANRDYWDDPRPYPDQLEIISIDDDTARLNALLAGKVDIISDLPPVAAKAGANGKYKVVIGAAGVNKVFYMRVDKPPFDDVRVRTAMKLIADRPALIQAAYSGLGDVANDVFGSKGLQYYDADLSQRAQDIEQAKSLLKSAGRSDLRFTLPTSSSSAGFVEAAIAYAQQCKQAGVTAKIQRIQPSAYFDTAQGYLSHSFAQSLWSGASLSTMYWSSMISDAPVAETHYRSPEFDRLFKAAAGEVDEAKAQELWSQVQRLMWDDSGYLVWTAVKNAEGAANNVAGFGVPGAGWFAQLDDFSVWRWGFTA